MITESTLVNEKSTHRAEVVEIKLEKHPNADSLSVCKIHDYSYVANTEAWQGVKKALYIPPDSLVDTTRPEFASLVKDAKYAANCEKGGTYARIKAKNIRGIISYGYMIPLSDDAVVGANMAEQFGILHYEPIIEISSSGGEAAKPPPGTYFKYDVDSFMYYARKVFVQGEPVAVSEKIHGENSRFVYKNGEMHVSSRDEFKKEFPSKPTTTYEELLAQFKGDEEKAKNAYRKIENWRPKRNSWWVLLDTCPAIRRFCEANPGFTLYGEKYGMVKNYRYGMENKNGFAAFDILKPDATWMDFNDFLQMCRKYEVPTAPIIHESIPFDFDYLVSLAEGNTLMPNVNHIREGIVVGPVKERWNDSVGRVKLKIINPAYLGNS